MNYCGSSLGDNYDFFEFLPNVQLSDVWLYGLTMLSKKLELCIKKSNFRSFHHPKNVPSKNLMSISAPILNPIELLVCLLCLMI